MAVASRGTSTLNPNAPLFIPLAYQQVEDFSPEWWNLVKSSPWFRDYWLRERYDIFDDAEGFADLLLDEPAEGDDEDDFSELEEALLQYSTGDDGDVSDGTPYSKQQAIDVNEKEKEKDLVLVKALNGKPSKPRFESKTLEKPPHIVSVKTSPRRIQQPR